MFLSIIIPTWRNTEEEIRRCLDSIDQSAWRDFEVLLVDDGNEAAYATMLDGLAETYPMLRVFHVTHGGVSAARNFGVEKAVGEYILFVDADDIVTRQFWHDVAEIAEKGCEADVIYGRRNSLKNKDFVDDVSGDFSVQNLDESEMKRIYRYFFTQRGEVDLSNSKGHLSRGPWARILRRDFIKEILFDTSLFGGEDFIWNLKLISRHPQAGMTSHVWYRVLGNPESATRGYKFDLIGENRTLLRVLKRYIREGMEQEYCYRVFESVLDIAKRYYLSPQNLLPWFQKVKEFNQMAKTEPFDVLLKSNWTRGDIKTSVRFTLYRAGLLLYAYRLKMLLRR